MACGVTHYIEFVAVFGCGVSGTAVAGRPGGTTGAPIVATNIAVAVRRGRVAGSPEIRGARGRLSGWIGRVTRA